MPEDRVEVLRSSAEKLHKVVSSLTWEGRFWGLKGALRYAAQRAEYLSQIGEDRAAFSSLSSTYYAAAGNAGARARLVFWSRPYWLVLAWWCLKQAEQISDYLAKLFSDVKAIPPNMLDVRASILHRAGRYDEALVCLTTALDRKELPPDTRALLEIKRAEIADAQDQPHEAGRMYRKALALEVSPATRVRIYKSLGAHHRRYGEWEEAKKALEAAREIAEANNFGDQLIKIAALEREVTRFSSWSRREI